MPPQRAAAGDPVGLAAEPRFAIGQRALLVPHESRVLMWDCQTLLDDDGMAAVAGAGGLSAIAISHPHYYSSMVQWAHAFDCPVLLHADDAGRIMRPDRHVELWDGETRELGDGLTLLRLGGHFAGGTVLHLIPLGEREVRTIASKLEPYRFERILGAWWGTLAPRDGHGILERSAERHVRALRGDYPIAMTRARLIQGGGVDLPGGRAYRRCGAAAFTRRGRGGP